VQRDKVTKPLSLCYSVALSLKKEKTAASEFSETTAPQQNKNTYLFYLK